MLLQFLIRVRTTITVTFNHVSCSLVFYPKHANFRTQKLFENTIFRSHAKMRIVRFVRGSNPRVFENASPPPPPNVQSYVHSRRSNGVRVREQSGDRRSPSGKSIKLYATRSFRSRRAAFRRDSIVFTTSTVRFLCVENITRVSSDFAENVRGIRRRMYTGPL